MVAIPTFAPYPANNTYLPLLERDKFPSALAEPDKVKGQLFPDENVGKGNVVFPGVGEPSASRYSRYAAVDKFDKAAPPSPTRKTTNEVDPFPPPLELDELDELELDELELDELELDELEPEDELAPEPDDELELLEFPPPIPLLEAELLDETPPHSPPSPPFPLPIPGLFVPSAQAMMTNGVRARAEPANLRREREGRRSTTRPF